MLRLTRFVTQCLLWRKQTLRFRKSAAATDTQPTLRTELSGTASCTKLPLTLEIRRLRASEITFNANATPQAFTDNVTPSGRKLATSIKGRGLAGLTGRKHDLGEYLFFRAKKNNTCAQIRPTEIFRSWGNR
mgnify:CR=1 FL=1